MNRRINHVYTLRIETLSPVAILSGARLREEVDFFVNPAANTTCVIDSDRALELALTRWSERQPSPAERLARLEQRAERLAQRKARNIAEIERFEQSPPRDPRKRAQQKERLRAEAQKIREEERRLRAERSELEATGFAGPVVPDELLANSGFRDLIASDLLTEADLSPGSPLVRYHYSGRPVVASGRSEILACARDAFDRLYLPGSSLKGALRTILAWELAPARAGDALMSFADAGDKRQAARSIERTVFYGRRQRDDRRVSHDLLRDVMRVVHVGDSQPLKQMPVLLDVQVFPQGSPIAVEAIPAGAVVTAVVQVEQYPFTNREARAIIDFGDWPTRLQPATLAASGRRRAQVIIEGERAYFAGQRGADELSRFYAALAERLASLDHTNAFLAPIGWGAGWRSKTLDNLLRADERREPVFVQAMRRYRMKLNEQRSRRFSAGDPFPATRKVAMRNRQPWLPLGWVCITIEEGR